MVGKVEIVGGNVHGTGVDDAGDPVAADGDVADRCVGVVGKTGGIEAGEDLGEGDVAGDGDLADGGGRAGPGLAQGGDEHGRDAGAIGIADDAALDGHKADVDAGDDGSATGQDARARVGAGDDRTADGDGGDTALSEDVAGAVERDRVGGAAADEVGTDEDG